MSNWKIAVLGDRESVLGFKALGLSVFPAETAEEAKTVLHRLAKEDYPGDTGSQEENWHRIPGFPAAAEEDRLRKRRLCYGNPT